ncbi:GlxA family transcriptional regulator [Singulisphaera sp. PoT]|uniref:GlxA family transcriptional regulator n=1 Tax=Singulisphaera sp. PoT TaxID=3411797 RepID=UPI003BF4B592
MHVGKATRDVAFLVFPGFQIQDLSGPLAAFEVAGGVAGDEPYRHHVVSRDGGSIVSSCGLEVSTRPIQPGTYDTLVVVGGADLTGPSELNAMLYRTVREGVDGVRRVASVCTGAFILAGAGLLEGRHATTHWRYAALLQRQFPSVKVDGDRIFTRDGDVWTSAGITAGIDLALAMIEEDLGTEVSRSTAQILVVYHRRPGGQSQFSAMLDMEPESDRIRDVLTYIREHLTESLSIEDLAEVARLSSRQFGRVFLAQTGETPAKAVERLRAEAARPRVERGAEPIEAIARDVGFADPERMRRAFLRVFGHPPQSIRRMSIGESGRLQ